MTQRYPMEFARILVNKQRFEIPGTQLLLSTWTEIQRLSVLS